MNDFLSRGLPAPNLTVLLVGDDPASQTYVRNKRKAAKKVGMGGETIKLPSSTTQVRAKIAALGVTVFTMFALRDLVLKTVFIY